MCVCHTYTNTYTHTLTSSISAVLSRSFSGSSWKRPKPGRRRRYPAPGITFDKMNKMDSGRPRDDLRILCSYPFEYVGGSHFKKWRTVGFRLRTDFGYGPIFEISCTSLPWIPLVHWRCILSSDSSSLLTCYNGAITQG